jgi:hypothetical protein
VTLIAAAAAAAPTTAAAARAAEGQQGRGKRRCTRRRTQRSQQRTSSSSRGKEDAAPSDRHVELSGWQLTRASQCSKQQYAPVKLLVSILSTVLNLGAHSDADVCTVLVTA